MGRHLSILRIENFQQPLALNVKFLHEYRKFSQIAAFMKSHLFLGHPGVHKYVTDSWMGSLDPDTSYLNILVGILCTPIFIDIRRFKKIVPPANSVVKIVSEIYIEFFPVPCLFAPKAQKGIDKGKKSTRF